MHLVFIQLTARTSLRDGVASLKARFKNLYHIGARPVAGSPFSVRPTIGGGNILLLHLLQQGGAVEVEQPGRLALHPVASLQVRFSRMNHKFKQLSEFSPLFNEV